MKYRISLFSFLIIVLMGCRQTVVIPATRDTALSSSLPDRNISGKNQPEAGRGFGTVKRAASGIITYPAMYLGVGDPPYTKDAMVLGGFDLSGIKGNIQESTLVFFINYASMTRKNVILFVRPLLGNWDDSAINYLDIFVNDEPGADLLPLVEKDESKCKLVVFNLKRNEYENFDAIPFPNAKREVRINVTELVKFWQSNPDKNFGVLVDPMWRTDLRYCTVNEADELSDTGVIEVASSEWYDWYGIVPEGFVEPERGWVKVRNRAFHRMGFCPRLEVVVD